MSQLAECVKIVTKQTKDNFDDLEEDDQLCVIKYATAYENIPALEEILQWYVSYNCLTIGNRYLFQYAAMFCTVNVCDWLLTKFPNVAKWTGYGVWESLMPGNPCGEWLNDRTDVQKLALYNIEFLDLNDYYCLQHFQFLKHTTEIDESVFIIALRRKNYGILNEVAAKNPQAVRKLCLADYGSILQWRFCKKVKQVLLRAGLTQSDCASIGLTWPLL